MNSIHFWQTVCDCLRGNNPVALLLVAAAEGSSPGRPGFKMLAGRGERRSGTIGGGALERMLVERATELLSGPAPSPSWIQYQHRPDGETAVSSGMICSGGQTMVILPLKPEAEEAVGFILECLRDGRGVSLTVDAGGLHAGTEVVPESEPETVSWDPDEWRYREIIQPPLRMTIVGGGHVGLALSRVLTMLGYRVVILDDRPGLDTLRDNHDASEIRIIDYERVAEYVPTGERSHCVIMTHGHLADELVLRRLAGRRFGYLGMMGSRFKVAELFDRLATDGVPRAWLDRVSAPVGLPIGSQTPAEIAVSIAAELVRLRRGPKPPDANKGAS